MGYEDESYTFINVINGDGPEKIMSTIKYNTKGVIKGGNEENIDIYYLKDDRQEIKSFVHDVPLYPNPNEKSIVNMIVEIPRGTNDKMEMSVKHLNDIKEKIDFSNHDRVFFDSYANKNPIIPDSKKGKLRTVPKLKIEELNISNSNNYEIDHEIYKDLVQKLYGNELDKGYNLFSYGALPQTFETQRYENEKYIPASDYFQRFEKCKYEGFLSKLQTKHQDLQLTGDGDPLDICLMHSEGVTYNVGQVVPVRVIGVFPMIDDIKKKKKTGEVDWKIIAVPASGTIDLDQADIKNAKLWFQHYKDELEGNTINSGGIAIFDDLGKSCALDVIKHCHEDYYGSVIGDDAELHDYRTEEASGTDTSLSSSSLGSNSTNLLEEGSQDKGFVAQRRKLFAKGGKGKRSRKLKRKRSSNKKNKHNRRNKKNKSIKKKKRVNRNTKRKRGRK